MLCDVMHCMPDTRPLSLRELRENAGLTQQGLGRAAGLTQHCISQLETGKRRGTPPTLKKIALVLGVTVRDLRRSSTYVGTTDLPAEVAS